MGYRQCIHWRYLLMPEADEEAAHNLMSENTGEFQTWYEGILAQDKAEEKTISSAARALIRGNLDPSSMSPLQRAKLVMRVQLAGRILHLASADNGKTLGAFQAPATSSRPVRETLRRLMVTHWSMVQLVFIGAFQWAEIAAPLLIEPHPKWHVPPPAVDEDGVGSFAQ